MVKNPPANAGDSRGAGSMVKIPWRKWQPTPVFLLGNPTDRRATVHGVAAHGVAESGQD